MLRRDRQLRLQVYQFIDGGVFALGLWLAHLIRYHWKGLPFLSHEVDPITPFVPDYFWLFLVVIPMTPLILEWQGFYERPVFAPVREMLWQLGKACAICSVGLILIQFMLRREGARGVFVLFGFCSFGLMFLKEELVRLAYKSKLGQAQFRRRVILVGTAEDTQRLRLEIGQEMQELEIWGEFDLNKTSSEELVACFHEHSINAVVIAARHTLFGQVEQAIHACEVEGIEIWLLADFFKTQVSRTSVDDFHGRPVLVFHSGPETPMPRLIKQIVDLVGGLVLLAFFSPFMAVAAVLIKATSPGPVLFRQQRAGLNGKPFVMYKFRSMVSDAEQLQGELAALNEMSGPVFKVSRDPRVTPVGRVLRKFSIDETPQLFNVLRFEMSLVGPRPLPVHEVKRFDDLAHRRRLSVRPGLTCTWQVSGRSDVTDFKEWVRMDLEYIDHWSLGLDCKILWRTIWVVLLGKGAR
ncbi:MAG: sugar transferase [Verrucomicrobiota bacterium]|jgi:exopolysaccharide biosynthesis polyprenyl glycosylphosphotransferase